MTARADAGNAPRLTDQKDRVVAMRALGRNESGTNEYGSYDVPVAEALYNLDNAHHPSEVVHVPELPLFWSVVRRVVVNGEGEWVVGHLIQPGRSWQLSGERMSDQEVDKYHRRIVKFLDWRAENPDHEAVQA